MEKDDYQESKRFKAFRKHKGLTQKDMGKIIGKTQAMVQRYETGDYLIPGRVVSTLVNNLNLSFEWFFNGVGAMEREASTNSKNFDVNDSGSNESRSMLLELRIEKLEKQVKSLELLVKQLTDISRD